MATLVSPGVSISVNDQSMYTSSGPGTVPLIFIATAANKSDPTTTGSTAAGTVPGTSDTVWSITSQRDLISTFGDPTFYSVSGSSVNGYPLNEYGLLAAYSYLGVSNLAYIVRADLDLAALQASAMQPTSAASAGTFWLNETNTKFGLFKNNTTTWTSVTPAIIYNFTTGTTNTPLATDGKSGDIAIVFQQASGCISYWLYNGVNPSAPWVELGTSLGPSVVMQPVWPDLTTIPVPPATLPAYWVKTSTPAQGANIVIEEMSAVTNSFNTVTSPILASDTAADLFYSTTSTLSANQVYVQTIVGATASGTTPNELQIRYSTGATNSWIPFETVLGAYTAPTNGPANGAYWFNGLQGLDSSGLSTVDLLVSDGQDHWENCNLPGYTLPGATNNPTLYTQPSDPRGNLPVPTLNSGDIWVQTGGTPYPVIYRWVATTWVLVINTDQTTPNGIIFQDARPSPLFKLGGVIGTGVNNGGGNYPDLDPDAPQAALYPKGFLLWNTRASTNVVKQWNSTWIADGITSSPDNTNNGSTGRWVNVSGNSADGTPQMGSNAQQAVVVKAIKSVIESNTNILSETLNFNLIAAPGYVECISDMLTLNDSRADTAFVIGDTPFTLNPDGTSLQKWATNANLALEDGPNGLVSASKYFGCWYPSGLGTNTDGTSVVVPPSHMALRTIAYSDQISYPWFAPAGLQRGVVNNVSDVGYVNSSGEFKTVQLGEGQRNILYTHNINPIRIMPNGGIVLYGQKTRQNYSSATDRINVVRLENYIRYQMNILAQPFLFQPDDDITRKAILASANSFLSELVTLRALYAFVAECDKGNNTNAEIDAHELYLNIAIQPEKDIEFIYIPITIQNTGASLTIT